MALKDCYSALSAGVVLEGDVAVVTFLGDGLIEERNATILLTPDGLRGLYRSIGIELARIDRQKKMLREALACPIERPRVAGVAQRAHFS